MKNDNRTKDIMMLGFIRGRVNNPANYVFISVNPNPEDIAIIKKCEINEASQDFIIELHILGDRYDQDIGGKLTGAFEVAYPRYYTLAAKYSVEARSIKEVGSLDEMTKVDDLKPRGDSKGKPSEFTQVVLYLKARLKTLEECFEIVVGDERCRKEMIQLSKVLFNRGII